MVWSYVDSEGSSGSGTSWVLDLPAGPIEAGDLLIACFHSGSTSLGSGHADWTRIGASATNNQDAFYRVADGTESASYTFTNTFAVTWLAIVGVYRGVDVVASPHKDVASSVTGSSPPPKSVTLSAHAGQLTDTETYPMFAFFSFQDTAGAGGANPTVSAPLVGDLRLLVDAAPHAMYLYDVEVTGTEDEPSVGATWTWDGGNAGTALRITRAMIAYQLPDVVETIDESQPFKRRRYKVTARELPYSIRDRDFLGGI